MFIVCLFLREKGLAGLHAKGSKPERGGGFVAGAVQSAPLGWDCTAEAASAVRRSLRVSGRTGDAHGGDGHAAPPSRAAGSRWTGVQVVARAELPDGKLPLFRQLRRRLKGAAPYCLCRVPRVRVWCRLIGCLLGLSESSCKECALLANRCMHVALHSNATGRMSGGRYRAGLVPDGRVFAQKRKVDRRA